jgi:hypothetical protein
MPMHDWTRVSAGLFHDFHQTWSIFLKMSLNAGLLPNGLSALVEQRAGPKEADVLTVESRHDAARGSLDDGGGVLTLERPVTSIMRETEKSFYSVRANRIVVRHQLGRIVAVIEIVSPGNKDSRAAMRDFIDKTIDLLRAGIHVLIVDLFPPSPRDPYGIHKAIWDEIHEEDFTFPPGKDRILASYETGGMQRAHIEPVGVGDRLPNMPLFLAEGLYVLVPLERTYEQTWEACPKVMRTAVETGILPNPNADE